MDGIYRKRCRRYDSWRAKILRKFVLITWKSQKVFRIFKNPFSLFSKPFNFFAKPFNFFAKPLRIFKNPKRFFVYPKDSFSKITGFFKNFRKKYFSHLSNLYAFQNLDNFHV